MDRINFIFLYLLFCAPILFSQNVGIETKQPRSTLEVKGTIASTQNGFLFPDGTTQRTANATNNPVGASVINGVYADFSDGIVGEVTSPAQYNDHVQIIAIHNQLFRNVATNGSPADSLHHRPFVITKDVDTATPDLYTKMKNKTKGSCLHFVNP